MTPRDRLSQLVRDDVQARVLCELAALRHGTSKDADRALSWLTKDVGRLAAAVLFGNESEIRAAAYAAAAQAIAFCERIDARAEALSAGGGA